MDKLRTDVGINPSVNAVGVATTEPVPVPSVAARHLPALRGVTLCKGGGDFETDLPPLKREGVAPAGVGVYLQLNIQILYIFCF